MSCPPRRFLDIDVRQVQGIGRRLDVHCRPRPDRREPPHEPDRTENLQQEPQHVNAGVMRCITELVLQDADDVVVDLREHGDTRRVRDGIQAHEALVVLKASSGLPMSATASSPGTALTISRIRSMSAEVAYRKVRSAIRISWNDSDPERGSTTCSNTTYCSRRREGSVVERDHSSCGSRRQSAAGLHRVQRAGLRGRRAGR